MRTILGLLSLLCIIVSCLLIISIPFLGLFKVFSLFPDWVYIILFLGVIIPYIAKENAKDEALHKQQLERNEPVSNPKEIAEENVKGDEQDVTPQENTEEKISADNSDKNQPVMPAGKHEVKVLAYKGNAQFENGSYEHYRWQENKQPISEFLPVRIIAVNGCVINPYDQAAEDDIFQIPFECRDDRPYGEIQIEQVVFRKKWTGSEFVREKRNYSIKAPIAELEELVIKNRWVNDSTIPGAITITEVLSRVWINERNRKDLFGFTYDGKFFEVRECISYSEEIASSDSYLTVEMAQMMVEDILNINPENLPF